MMMHSEARKISRVLITRSKSGNEELAGKLRARGFEPVRMDTMEFLPPADWAGVDAALARLGDFNWLAFTSATGAGFFADRMRTLALPLAWGGKPSVAAVGPSTRAALLKAGARVDYVPSKYTAEKLADELPDGQGNDVLLLRAEAGNPGFVPALEGRGFRVTDVPIYRTSSLAGGAARLPSKEADAVIFASPSAVDIFTEMLGPGEAVAAKDMLAVCIGPATAAAAQAKGFGHVVAPRAHTMEGLLDCLAQVSGEVS